MRAIVRDGGVRLVERTVPEPGPDDVIIDVAYAGVCRTDLAVADGVIAVARGRVLGHELAGRVRACGGRVRGLAAGDAVTAVPFFACGACAGCRAGKRCGQPRWLGIDADGGFADCVRVPAACALRLPRGMSLALGAYVEPVAAALGSLAFVDCGARVAVFGEGRIAELSARVLAAHGAVVTRCVGGEAAGAFDVAVEHDGAPAAALAVLRPGGTLILKSRGARPVSIDAAVLVARDLVVRGASHGSFAAAIDWLATRRIHVDDLLAPPAPLEAFADVLSAARTERQKPMFAPGGAA